MMAAVFTRKRSVLWIMTALAAVPAYGEDVEHEQELEPVVVSANKAERPISKVTAAVQVIDAKKIEQTGAATLKDVFAKTPGLILQYGTFPSGSAVSKSSVNLRGVGATGSLWLLDGRRLAGEVNNPYDMDRIPASMIERIEIVKGPMSALYGADAMGGVINIITKQPARDGVKGEVSASAGINRHGDGGNKQIGANVQAKAGRFAASLYASHIDSDPYGENETTATRVGPRRLLPQQMAGATGNANIAKIKASYEVPVSYRENAKVSTLGGRFTFDAADSLKLGAEFNWFDEKRNGAYRGVFHPSGYKIRNPAGQAQPLPAFDVPVLSRDHNRRLDLAADAKYEFGENANAKLRVYRSSYKKRNTTTLSHYADFGYADEDASATGGMNANVRFTGYELSSNWQIAPAHLLTGGLEYRREIREATVLAPGNEFNTRKAATAAVYLQDDFTLGDSWAFTVGGRYDRYKKDAYTDANNQARDAKNHNKTTFRVGAVKKFGDAFSLRANIAQGYRVPDVRELFVHKQTPAGMQLGADTIDGRFGKTAYELKPESSVSYELGASGKAGRLSYGVNLFHNRMKDRITQVSRPSANPATAGLSYYTFENVSKARSHGIEANLNYRITPQLSASFDWTELRTRNQATGRELDFSPRRLVGTGLNWQAERLSAGVQLKHVGRQQYQEGQAFYRTKSYTLTNLNAAYLLGAQKQIRLYGGIDNVFNRKVDKKLGSDVGTYFYGGVKYAF